ncbi:MAG: hypothetical protein IMY76_07500 [Chloroflexi bacterium]|nr:hypothetical protein [Chloroflexota bacterium]
MIAAPHAPGTIDPVYLLDSVIDDFWRALSDTFDIIAETPSLCELFYDVDLTAPHQNAESVLVNMLMEVTENVDRFSPWYTRPARAYGLISIRDGNTNRFKWVLAPEALRRWHDYLKELRLAIQKNSGMLQASLFIGQLTIKELSHAPQITAQCNCYPPKIIHLKESILGKTSIVCDICNHPFFPEIS